MILLTPSLLEIQCEQETSQFVVDFCPLPAQKGGGRQRILSAPKGNLEFQKLILHPLVLAECSVIV